MGAIILLVQWESPDWLTLTLQEKSNPGELRCTTWHIPTNLCKSTLFCFVLFFIFSDFISSCVSGLSGFLALFTNVGGSWAPPLMLQPGNLAIVKAIKLDSFVFWTSFAWISLGHMLSLFGDVASQRINPIPATSSSLESAFCSTQRNKFPVSIGLLLCVHTKKIFEQWVLWFLWPRMVYRCG